MNTIIGGTKTSNLLLSPRFDRSTNISDLIEGVRSLLQKRARFSIVVMTAVIANILILQVVKMEL